MSKVQFTNESIRKLESNKTLAVLPSPPISDSNTKERRVNSSIGLLYQDESHLRNGVGTQLINLYFDQITNLFWLNKKNNRQTNHTPIQCLI